MSILQPFLYISYLGVVVGVIIAFHAVTQLLRRNPHEPPIVPYLFPFLGSAVNYGRDPYAFFSRCRQRYGDIFSFTLLGKRITVCLGTEGNDFILNGKLQDLNAEDIYTHLTTPVFGEGVVYDCSNATMMEQKKFLKFGLTTEALQSYVPLFEVEFDKYLAQSDDFRAYKGKFNVNKTMAELTIFMASRTLQGKEVRARFDTTFAQLYHDLDMGFTPINFMLPWLPLPQNRRRDRAQKILAQTYISIIETRRKSSWNNRQAENDMIRHLMSARYKNGNAVSDKEIAHIMIALLMAGQHSSSSIGAWIMLRLASRPDVMEELYEEQARTLGAEAITPLSFEKVKKLSLNSLVVKETLRLHAPIHSIMRAVKTPLVVYSRAGPNGRNSYTIPTSHVLLSAPGVTAQSPEHFPNPEVWDPHRWETIADVKESSEKVDYGYGLVTKGASSPYLPFGAGRHRCIGEQFAYLQLGTITALMVRKFKLKALSGKEGALPGTNYSSLFTRPLDPAIIEWQRR